MSASHPPPESAGCKICAQPMELLIQIWCPLEDSPNDRSLFVWACANGSCQRKEGRCVLATIRPMPAEHVSLIAPLAAFARGGS